MPNAVAMPSSTGNEIRPRKVIRALSTFLHLTVKRLEPAERGLPTFIPDSTLLVPRKMMPIPKQLRRFTPSLNMPVRETRGADSWFDRHAVSHCRFGQR